MAGFGSTIIAVALGASLYPIHYLIPVLVPINILLSAYFVARYWKFVQHLVLWKKIVPVAGIGVVVGILIFNLMQNNILKFVYGIFIIGFSVYELSRILFVSEQIKLQPLSRFRAVLWLFAGGIIHGTYLSGGPLIVYYGAKELPDKQNFRITLSALWLVLNVFLLGSHIFSGKTNFHTLKASILLLPALVLGIVVGDWLHYRIKERIFRMFVFILLFVAGISLL